MHAGQVQEIAGHHRAVADDANVSALLDDELSAAIGRILDD